MKKNSWSSKAVGAAGAYYVAKKVKKKKKAKLWSGYGYEDDEEYMGSRYSQIENCFTCTSVNNDNPQCERQDSSISTNSLSYRSCASTHYCGLVLGGDDSSGDTFLEVLT